MAADRSVLRDVCGTDTRRFASGSGRGHGAVRCGGNRDANRDGCHDRPWDPGTTVAGKVQICPTPGYSEPLQLYTATILPSGNRKTAVINEMASPFRKAEARLVDQLTPERKRLQSQRKTEELSIEKLRKRAVDAPDSSALIAEIAQREADLREVPAIPRFWTQDITPERLGVLMAENDGRMAVISDEGGIFDILAGRYSKTASPNLDLFLQGHSGSPVRVDRGSREPVLMNSPALTLVLTPQPAFCVPYPSTRLFAVGDCSPASIRTTAIVRGQSQARDRSDTGIHAGCLRSLYLFSVEPPRGCGRCSFQPSILP